VQASEYRVTIDQVAKAAGIIINDTAAELKSIKIVRGCIYMCNMSNVLDSETGGIRPVVIIQNQLGNDKSSLSIVAPITSAINKNRLPTHVPIGYESGLVKESEVLLEQITRVSKRRLLFNEEIRKVGDVPEYLMNKIESAIKKSMGLIPLFFDEKIALEYLTALYSIKNVNNRNKGIRIAETIIQNKFEEYCINYGKDCSALVNYYNTRREEIYQSKLQPTYAV
jgi:mRNA interferase MazF